MIIGSKVNYYSKVSSKNWKAGEAITCKWSYRLAEKYSMMNYLTVGADADATYVGVLDVAANVGWLNR